VAQRTVLVDDIDNSVAEETVPFALDGVSYEIDLNAKNAAKLRDVLAAYVGVARRVGRPTGATRGRVRRGSDLDTAAIRAWAREQNIQVNERGRIPAELVDRYTEAHK
jgi:hypothetical protein